MPAQPEIIELYTGYRDRLGNPSRKKIVAIEGMHGVVLFDPPESLLVPEDYLKYREWLWLLRRGGVISQDWFGSLKIYTLILERDYWLEKLPPETMPVKIFKFRCQITIELEAPSHLDVFNQVRNRLGEIEAKISDTQTELRDSPSDYVRCSRSG